MANVANDYTNAKGETMTNERSFLQLVEMYRQQREEAWRQDGIDIANEAEKVGAIPGTWRDGDFDGTLDLSEAAARQHVR